MINPVRSTCCARMPPIKYRSSSITGRVWSPMELSGIVGNDPLVKCVGTAGTMAIGDTSRCFHFGSRPGKRERYVVMIQYITPFAAEFPIDAKSAGSKFSSLAARNEFGITYNGCQALGDVNPPIVQRPVSVYRARGALTDLAWHIGRWSCARAARQERGVEGGASEAEAIMTEVATANSSR